MKKKIWLSLCIIGMIFGNAQVKTPQASAASVQKTTVGLTDIEINYSRPSKKGRVIFGDVVPYDKIWRTGANNNTTISFSDDVAIDGKQLKAGKYGLFTKPGKEVWEVYFYTENDNWGNQVKWDDNKVALKTTAKVEHIANPVETFLISTGDLTYNTAQLNLLWDDVKISIEIKVPTEDKVMVSIEKTMKGNPTAKDYIAAANYFYSTGKEAQKAMEWVDKGMAQLDNPPYYQIYAQAAIHQKAGDKATAIKLAKEVLSSAEKSGDDAYVRMAKQALEDWK